jgi:ADP-heptose:LPS heptosyltransferase
VFSNLPLDLVAGILSQADLYLGNDSGVTHLAAAVRDAGGRATPTVALFGPSDVRLWAPRGPHVRIVQSPDGTMDAMAVDRVWREIDAMQPGGK